MVALALLGSHKYLLPSETASRESFISLASQTENMCKNILPNKNKPKRPIFTYLVLDKSKNVMYLWKSATLTRIPWLDCIIIISEEPLRLCTGTHTFHEKSRVNAACDIRYCKSGSQFPKGNNINIWLKNISFNMKV